MGRFETIHKLSYDLYLWSQNLYPKNMQYLEINVTYLFNLKNKHNIDYFDHKIIAPIRSNKYVKRFYRKENPKHHKKPKIVGIE